MQLSQGIVSKVPVSGELRVRQGAPHDEACVYGGPRSQVMTEFHMLPLGFVERLEY